MPDLPAPGDTYRDRTVKASGTLPYSGRPFVVVRHTGREQLASIRSAQATAKAEGVDPSPIDSVLHLVPQVTYLGEDLERTKFDDILDLDGDDLDALFEVFAPSGGVEGPPSPSS